MKTDVILQFTVHMVGHFLYIIIFSVRRHFSVASILGIILSKPEFIFLSLHNQPFAFIPGGGEGVYSWKIRVECAACFLKPLLYIRPNRSHFPRPEPNFYTLFQTTQFQFQRVQKILTDFRPKRLKSISNFRRKWFKNHTLWHRTYLYSLYMEVPPLIYDSFQYFFERLFRTDEQALANSGNSFFFQFSRPLTQQVL